MCDAVVLIVVLLSFIAGWVRGATKEVFAIVAWIGGVYLTVAAFPHVQGFTREHINHGLIADFVTVCGLFVAFLAVLSVVNHLCSNFVKKSVLSTVNNVLGGAFGLVRGVVILAVADIVISQCFTEMPEMIKTAKLRPVINGIANVILLVLPDSVQHKLIAHMSQIRKQNLLDFIRANVIDSIVPNAVDQSQEQNVVAEKNGETASDYTESLEAVDDANATTTDNQRILGQTAEDLASLKPRRTPENQTKSGNVPHDVSGDVQRNRTTNDMNRMLASIE
ncbi:MAG: CvpA family protein [Holosporales bacterium]|nr:CvpA family protein [Holosporales bacterium]